MALQSTNFFAGTDGSNIELVKVCFPTVDVSDTILKMGTGGPFADYGLVAVIIVSNLPTCDSRFWIEKDINGIPILCTTKIITNPSGSSIAGTTTELVGTFVAAGTIIAVPMVAVDFVGGRPTVHR